MDKDVDDRRDFAHRLRGDDRRAARRSTPPRCAPAIPWRSSASAASGCRIVAGCANLSAYPIIVVDLSDEKLEFAKKFGATIGINARNGDPVARDAQDDGRRLQPASTSPSTRSARKVTMEQILQMARATALRRQRGRHGGRWSACRTATGRRCTMGMIFGGKIYRGAVGGCSMPDRDFPLYVRWFKEGKLPLDKHGDAALQAGGDQRGCRGPGAGQDRGPGDREF